MTTGVHPWYVRFGNEDFRSVGECTPKRMGLQSRAASSKISKCPHRRGHAALMNWSRPPLSGGHREDSRFYPSAGRNVPVMLC